MERSLSDEIKNKKGEQVKLSGWVSSRRDHGKIIFIDLKDRKGITQLVFTPDSEKTYKKAKDLRDNYVIQIKGDVNERPEDMKNEKIESGEVEVKVNSLEIISEAETSPFPTDNDGYKIDEEKRLEYRYLDLRRERLQHNLKKRAEVKNCIRDYLRKKDFLEVETPILTKSTPEGARDFLVPSRLNPGKFYALPQSPQQYKQLLMVSGIERYFQFPHVFRDEDLRADRLFEHTQLDLELAFTSEEEIRNLIEEMVIKVTEEVMGKKIQEKPFPRIPYKEAMEKYGKDDPDLQKGDKIAYVWVVDFPMFEEKEDGSLGAAHHPFTSMKDKYKKKFQELSKKEKLNQIKAKQFDLVANGHEIFGGSIREKNPEILKQVFEFLGHSKKQVEKKFGHLLKAFKFGAPPHGGMASGLDRWLQVLLDEESIRETVTFPTTTSGKTSVMDAPCPVSDEQLKELGLKIRKEK